MNKRVLVIDDDAAVREAMKRVLETAGYEVALAQNGEEAAAQFRPEHTDLLLLDLNLPAQSGWDIFQRLTSQYPLVPVIVITGMANQLFTAAAAGVSALMEKPIEPAALLQTIDDVLAEPADTRLRRMCGYGADLRLVRPRSQPETWNQRDALHQPGERARREPQNRSR